MGGQANSWGRWDGSQRCSSSCSCCVCKSSLKKSSRLDLAASAPAHRAQFSGPKKSTQPRFAIGGVPYTAQSPGLPIPPETPNERAEKVEIPQNVAVVLARTSTRGRLPGRAPERGQLPSRRMFRPSGCGDSSRPPPTATASAKTSASSAFLAGTISAPIRRFPKWI